VEGDHDMEPGWTLGMLIELALLGVLTLLLVIVSIEEGKRNGRHAGTNGGTFERRKAA
jgi:hypothetical protein